jgi:AcrR family transcriptional regulator
LHPRPRAGKVLAMKHKRSELTRARIVSAARALFLEKGFDQTSVAEICRASGVSNGGLFHQYPVKEDIAFAVYTEVRWEFWDRVVGAMVAKADPLDGVEAAVRAAFAFQREEPDAAAFMFDVTGSGWIVNYAAAAQPLHDAGTQRGLAWAIPHIQAGRLPATSPDTFVALVSGAPQWIGRMIRIGMASSALDTLADEMAATVRRAFTIG